MARDDARESSTRCSSRRARAAARSLGTAAAIVLVSSTAGQRGEAFHADYAASKGAMISFVKSIAIELAPRDITVNAVAPGWVDTEMVRPAVRRRRARADRGGDSTRPDRRRRATLRRRSCFSAPTRAAHHGRDPERQRRQRALRMIVLLFTGGTISMRHDAAAGGAVPSALGARDHRRSRADSRRSRRSRSRTGARSPVRT